MKFVFFSFRRTEKIDSVMKKLMGQCPSPRIFGLEPSLVLCGLMLPRFAVGDLQLGTESCDEHVIVNDQLGDGRRR